MEYTSKQKLAMLTRAPLTAPPSTAANSLFGKTADLKAIIAKIKAIESNSPSLKKYSIPKMPTGNLCNKKDLETARRHLAVIAYKTPAKASLTQSAPATAEAPTKPAAAIVGRTAQELLTLDPADQNELIFSALPQAAKKLRDELRAAYASAPAALQAKFADTFRNALAAHEPELAPTISKQAFDQLSPRQKSDTCRAGIKIIN